MEVDPREQLVASLPRLRRFAYSLTGSSDEADDLVHAAVERALSRLHQWQPGTQFSAWMFSIIRTTWLNQVRSSRLRGWHESLDQRAELDDQGLGARGVESSVSLNEVRRAIARLPEQQRTILFLVCVEGLKYKEAAAVLDIPVGTVMSRMARARMMLIEELGLGDNWD